MPYKCDVIVDGKECGKVYEKARGLSAHRAFSHDIHVPLVDSVKEERTKHCPLCNNGQLYGEHGLIIHLVQVHEQTRNKNLRLLPGVGDLTESVMHKIGIDTIEKVATFTPESLAQNTGISMNYATKMVEAAKELTRQAQGRRKSYVANRERYNKAAIKRRKKVVKEKAKKWEVPEKPEPVVLPEPMMVSSSIPSSSTNFSGTALFSTTMNAVVEATPETIKRWITYKAEPKTEKLAKPKAEVYCVACGWVGNSTGIYLRWKSPHGTPHGVCPKCESPNVRSEAEA